MSDLLQRLRAALANLNPRERAMLFVAGALAGILILFVGVVQPAVAARERAAQRVANADRSFEAMLRLRQEYEGIHRGLASVERRIAKGPRGNIFTTLENMARQAALKVDSMDPQSPLTSDGYRETKVQVVLRGVTLSQTVNYLHRIEAAPQVLSVKSLRVRTRADKTQLLDVTFTVSSFEPV